jgi:HTH-type transcriptional regulator / antitoxin HigA
MVTDIRIIRDEAGYMSAMAEFEAFFDNEPRWAAIAPIASSCWVCCWRSTREEHFPLPQSGPAEAIASP